eukprot:jgi/Mesvir1/1286/Mv03754-RA.1
MAQRVPLSFLTSDAPTRPVVVIADSNPFSELVYTAPPSPFDPWSDVGNFYRDNYPPFRIRRRTPFMNPPPPWSSSGWKVSRASKNSSARMQCPLRPLVACWAQWWRPPGTAARLHRLPVLVEEVHLPDLMDIAELQMRFYFMNPSINIMDSKLNKVSKGDRIATVAVVGVYLAVVLGLGAYQACTGRAVKRRVV